MEELLVGNAPCSWGTLEFDEAKGEQIRFDRMLDELAESGYTGTELGDWGYMPTDPAVLRAELDKRGLVMLGAFVPVALKEPSAHQAGIAGAVKTARLLAAARDTIAGNVVFMFQPGEEGFDGARKMISEGVLEAAGRRPDAAFALHVISNMTGCGQVVSRVGPLMAASDGMFVTVRGMAGHGSSPHLSRDPVPATCEMVVALQTAINRQVDAFAPVVLTVGSIHAGTRRNIIPETATFEATVRTFDPQVRGQVRDLATRVCRGIAAAHGLEVDVEYVEEYPVTVNDRSAVTFALGVAADVLGEDRSAILEKPVTGTEDFSRVIAEVPGAMLFLGACLEGRDPQTAPSNHSPRAAFDDKVIADGAALYAELALRRLVALAG
jgi:hippurate hydrolase